MNAEQLLTHFDRITDAIPRLRRFILDPAVRGKLVPQDPNDEPASELLKRITSRKAEKKRKTGDTRIKLKPNPKPDVLPMVLPHQIRDGEIEKHQVTDK